MVDNLMTKVLKVYKFSVALLAFFVLSSCSMILPGPDKLHKNLSVPLGKYDGSRRYFKFPAIDAEAADYSKQEYFEGDFRGNYIELLVNWEKEGDSLVMVASAVAGQPVFVVKQQGRQLVNEHRYFDLPGLKISWLLGDYQLVNLPIDRLNTTLSKQSVTMIETTNITLCKPEFDENLVCVKLRYLIPSSELANAATLLDQANLQISYYAKPGKDTLIERIKVINTRWGYSYTVNVL